MRSAVVAFTGGASPVTSPTGSSIRRLKAGTGPQGRHMSDVDDIEGTLEEDEILEEELDDDAEPSAAEIADATVPPEPGGEQVESIQEILVKQEAAAESEEAPDEEEEVLVAAMAKDEKLEPLETRVVPIQSTEFTCKKCFLVKHRSQLADKKKLLCRDCA
jgi:hypothetical protein